MKRILISFITCVFCACSVLAAGRGGDTVLRTNASATSGRDSGNVSSRSATTVATPRVVSSRSATTVQVRDVNSRVRAAQTRVKKTGRSAITVSSGTRNANVNGSKRPARSATKQSIARIATNTVATNTFGDGYDECQAAYFTCMDQFCALQNESYRRCICSSKLETVKARERALSQTTVQLQDFKDLNLDAILKTPAEVKAMLSATEGEKKLAKKRDNSASMQKLTAITDVLEGTRTNALSMTGQLDAGGDIKQIWTTTDLISGANIANLTGESLYNAVHSQCAELVAPQCPSKSTLSMVMSAYGMYIENDCETLLTALNKQATNANTAIRQTNREMNMARLENYDAHNSVAINDCVAGVRADLTADTACGANYVHCLDLTGRYLNRVTGEPIYTANFYELNGQVSLLGDVLTNTTNAKIVAELNRKKEFANHTLETCRDIADEVWNEFMRQAITEIYQGQQEKIRQVKNECMDVVTTCYDETTAQLRDYSNIEEQMLLGDRLELSEEMCEEKMATCSNLYGGGSVGLQLLITEMRKITENKIAQNCFATLQEYAKKLCRVEGSDTLHNYPYGCRVYTPGDILYATNPNCTYLGSPAQQQLPDDELISSVTMSGGGEVPNNLSNYMCWENRRYTECNANYFLWQNACYKCPGGFSCAGGAELPRSEDGTCAAGYMDSLYQKMVVYALQYCVRPSTASVNPILPNEVLADVNRLMDTVRSDMATVLAAECDRLGGEWTTNFAKVEGSDLCEPVDSDVKHTTFYDATGASLCWGLCKKSD